MADGVRQWTEPQRAAIDTRENTILVSAAAGSGKTAVLTQRIIERLTDPKDPGDISRMLVVTFTRAAASELRERIGNALKAEMKNNPDSADRLREQYLLLSGAKISTVHSFCLDVIKSKFALLGLSSKVRVFDDGQAKLMSRRIMDEVIEEFYNSDESESFSKFSENLVSLHDDGLADILCKIYTKISSFADGVDFVRKCSEDYKKCTDKRFEETKWGKIALGEIKTLYSSYAAVCRAACALINDEEDKTFLPYLPAFEYDLQHAESVLLRLTGTVEDAIKELKNYMAVPLGRVKKELQTDEIKFFRDMRSDFSKAREDLESRYFSESEEAFQKSADESASFCEMLYSILSEFEKRFSAEKNKRSALDYADLERLTLNLLISNSEPTSVARELSERFDEVMIDEYQDINDVQDMIFSSFTSLLTEKGGKGTKRFMVGDVKQSIYGFRGAEPSIFARYRSADFVKKIFLSHNFRCDEKIIEFSNDVCGFLFRNASKLPYRQVDDLVFAKKTDKAPILPKVILVEPPKSDDEVKIEAAYYEALEVADNIKRLVKKEGRKPSDIAILLRSTVAASYYERALQSKGISFTNSCTGDLFAKPEVLLVVSLLNCINNPTNDIYLAATLKSPIYGFTLDDLVKIRKSLKDGCLYDALVEYSPYDESGRSAFFFEKLNEYREKAEAEQVDTLLRYVYDDAHILQAICGDDEEKRDSLLLFYEFARNYESGSFKGLYNFISHINELMSSGAAQKEIRASKENSDMVNIMTIHQSKGLEFPVCFVCDTARKPNRADIKERVIIDKELGIAPKLADETGYAYYDTLFRRSQNASIVENMNEEEIRILYVALTRAREELYVTAAIPNASDFVEETAQYAKFCGDYPAYTLQKSPSFIKWILFAFNSSDGVSAEIAYRYPGLSEPKLTEFPGDSAAKGSDNGEHDDKVRDEIIKRLNSEYSYKAVSGIPAKTAVSDLTPSLLDVDTDGEFGGLTTIRKLKTPKFISESKEETDFAKIGTATHIFMQFCDFQNVENNGASAERERLIAKGFISNADAERIDMNKVAKFFDSDLYKAMRSAVSIHRELRFNVKLPASDFSENPELKAALEGEEILVQGVVDCVFELSDGTLVIADYKTDLIPRDYANDREGFKDLIRERHSKQLNYYTSACEKMFRKKVSRALVYSFSLGESVDIF